MKSILVLCPLKMELEGILGALQKKGFAAETHQVGPLTIHEIPKLRLKLSLAGHGKTQFGIQTQFLIQHFKNLDAVICAGCAGTLSDDAELFDVIIAEKTVEHDYQLKFIQRALPEFPGDKKLINQLRGEKISGFKIRFGIIASGDEDVIESSRAKQIAQSTGALAVAWEGAGGARAARFNSVPFLEIRGITDRADSKAISNFNANLQQAMAHVAECLVLLVQ